MVSITYCMIDRNYQDRREVLKMIAASGMLPLTQGLARARSDSSTQSRGRDQKTTPHLSPVPQSIEKQGQGFPLPATAALISGESTDTNAIRELEETLRSADVRVQQEKSSSNQSGGPLSIYVGIPAESPRVSDALGQLDASYPEDLQSEGYVLATGQTDGKKRIVLAGSDEPGTFYAAQTFKQLLIDHQGRPWVPGVMIRDHPSMTRRGTIEGFYGSPWSHEERLDQLGFYGDVKMNTYVYAPKDDPYHREQWREPYPSDRLSKIGELVEKADRNHVDFVFALSPGTSICYSSESDYRALLSKFESLYDLGVRAFSIPLDDIDYTEWNCEADQQEYGPPSPETAANAQIDLLNRVQRDFIEAHGDIEPLQTVPTEYSGLERSSYKSILEEDLADEITVMWTGTAVVPPEITREEAEQVHDLFGHDIVLWDNYPVNDFSQTAGRLLLAPYRKREPNLSENLAGIVSNPMNQAAASKVALFTIADYTWNDMDYDSERSWHEAARYLADDNEETVQGLMAFFDLNHLAPRFGPDPWQPQAPILSEKITEFWTTYDGGEKETAINNLLPYARLIARSPQLIENGVDDKLFIRDADRWLEATDLWGDGLIKSLQMLAAHIEGDDERVQKLRNQITDRVDQAQQIHSPPGENRVEGVVKVGDGVLDVFIEETLNQTGASSSDITH